MGDSGRIYEGNLSGCGGFGGLWEDKCGECERLWEDVGNCEKMCVGNLRDCGRISGRMWGTELLNSLPHRTILYRPNPNMRERERLWEGMAECGTVGQIHFAWSG